MSFKIECNDILLKCTDFDQFKKFEEQESKCMHICFESGANRGHLKIRFSCMYLKLYSLIPFSSVRFVCIACLFFVREAPGEEESVCVRERERKVESDA